MIGVQQYLVEFGFHCAQEITADRTWIEIGFEVEARQLGTEAGIVDIFQNTIGYRRRIILRIDDIHFLLDADALNIPFDHIPLDHDLERSNIIQHGPHESSCALLIRRIVHLMLAHERIITG